jgi:hypothetical protein
MARRSAGRAQSPSRTVPQLASGSGQRDAGAYDRAISSVCDALSPFAITGWHCTRLTDEEISAILADGMKLPGVDTLHRRIEALVSAGKVSPQIETALKASNQAADSNRAGMLWFCFFPPGIAGEGGIGRLFRHWGGEALYNSHEDDEVTSPVLRGIGAPAIIEADVPIAFLRRPYYGLAMKIVRIFLIDGGYHTQEPTTHSDRITQPLPANFIRRIIRYPEADFFTLAGCSTWRQPFA